MACSRNRFNGSIDLLDWLTNYGGYRLAGGLNLLAKLIGKDKAWVSGMLRILTLPVKVQRKVGTSQLSVSYDSMIRIARLDEARRPSDRFRQRSRRCCSCSRQVVTKMRSSQTMGEECPVPGIETFQRTLSLALQVMSSLPLLGPVPTKTL